MRLHPPPTFSLSLFVFNNRYEEILDKREKEKGEKRKRNSHPFGKSCHSFPLVSNKWMIPYITIRRPAVVAVAAAAVAITGKQKRNRKDKIGKARLRTKQMAVQHKVAIPVNCELTPRPPARSPPLSHAETACRDLSLFFFQLISLTMLSYLIISFIHLLL